jgi:hypothetical protein
MAANEVPKQNVSRAPPETAADVPSSLAADAPPTVPPFVDPTPILACCANAAVGINDAIAAVTATVADKIASVLIVLFMNEYQGVILFSRFETVFGKGTY